MNVHVFDVDGCGKSFQRVVVKAMQRCHEAQIFGNALRDGLGQSMILNRQCDVAAQQFQRVQFAGFIQRVAGPAAESDDSGQPPSRF
jgi:hypothetical protein